MFQSQPICILQAGTTVDGRVIEQKIIDEIAETYSTEVYTARINEEHYDWSIKYGSVLSVEKRDDKLFAVIKPNSYLLRAVEQGQLLHTSCEFYEKFADTDKAYLSGLALTDKPASLGTTQIHLSSKNDGKIQVSSNFTIKPEQLSQTPPEAEESEASLLKKLIHWLKSEKTAESLSTEQDTDIMSQETEALLKQSVEQNQQLSQKLGQLIETLSAQSQPQEPESEPEPQTSPLEEKVEALSTQMESLVTQLSQLSDDQGRQLAGQGDDEEDYL